MNYFDKYSTADTIEIMGSYYEYSLIKNFYGDRVANRSKVPLMNHINEGCRIMLNSEFSLRSIQAFCLHPLMQHDDDYSANRHLLYDINIKPYVMYLTLEYRTIANAYLSHRAINSIDDIDLSSLEDVNNMLIADKIQNYKDFILYHKQTHERSGELDQYFKNWLNRLNISLGLFHKIRRDLHTS